MHHIYHTDAFVLKHIPVGEDSKILVLYTKELGLVYAKAQGIRKESSKLRYITQDGMHVSVDLVRGKEIWRLTTASLPHEAHIVRGIQKQQIFSRISALLVRLCTGEEANEELYTTIVRSMTLVQSAKIEELKQVELLSVARILVTLGYLGRDVLDKSDIKQQHTLIRDINRALAESQL